MISAGYDGDDAWEPDDTDLAAMRFVGLFPMGERHFDPEAGHFIDPAMDQAAGFDYEGDELIQMFRAVLFLRGWRLARRVGWPALVLLLLADLIREAEQDATGPLGTDRRPAADLTPPVALLRARSVLTAAPPARVPCPAGTTG